MCACVAQRYCSDMEAKDIATTIRFWHICDMLERIKKATTVTEKEKYLRRYYKSFLRHREAFRQQNGLTGEEDGNSSFYCILRCLIPNADSARQAYGLQKTTVGKTYIKLLHLSADSRNAQILASGRHFGDYADAVYRVLEPRCKRERSDLTLMEIHKMLDSIAEDDIRNTEMVLTRFTEIASAREQKWIVRLLLNSMSLGIGEQRIFALLHPQAKELYQRCFNLRRVCALLANNNMAEGAAGDGELCGGAAEIKLNDFIEPFQMLKPMLCERFAGDIQSLMAADVLYVETKMDGERFQLHYADEKFQYYSRNGCNYTDSFGADYHSGQLTPQLATLLPLGMESIILDGEMMVWDKSQTRYRPKGEMTDVKHLSGQSSWRPCFVVYDVLYYNGHSMLNMPYVQRTHKLRQMLKEQVGVLQLTKPQKITSLEAFKAHFQQALDADEEGVVVKKQNSVYMPGIRGGGGWYKIKADYIEGLTTDFDLIVMGGFYNRKKTFIESFLMGVLKGDAQKFEVFSVGKVANLTSQRVPLNNTLKAHWHQLAQEPPPLWYHYVASNAGGRPDVWIEPRNSVVLQIKAADLAPSSAFMLAKSLHFPRIQAWRNDKAWYDVMSWQEFGEMIQDKRGIKKIHKRQLTLDDLQPNAKKRKLTLAQQRKLALQKYEQKFDPKEIEQVSELLSGFSIAVLSASLSRNITPEELKMLAVRNGAEIVDYPSYHDPKCISIAGDITAGVKHIKDTRRYNIVTMSWFLNACEKQLLHLTPRDFLCMTAEVKERFAELCDQYGDSYTAHVGVEELEEILNAIGDKVLDAARISDTELDELQDELFANFSMEFFRKTQALFYGNEKRTQMARCTYEWRGGECLDLSHAKHIPGGFYIFIPSDCTRFDVVQFRAWLRNHFPDLLHKLKIVNINWVLDSHRASQLQDVSEYLWQAQ